MLRNTATHSTRRSDSFARWVARICGGLPIAAVAGAVLIASGCKQTSKLTGKQEKSDLLEAELRTREREILESRSEIQNLRGLVETYQRQGNPYGVPAPGCATPLGYVPHSANSPGPALRDVLLGNGTGGRDDDNIPGDEGLMVVIVPKDDDGTAIKALGHATVTALEINKEGLKRPIGKWEVSADQLRRTWTTGLIGSGYFVPLQWDRFPTTDRVRVILRFTTPDGREYEADRDAKVTPLAGMAQQFVPTMPVGPGIIVPPPVQPPVIPPEEILPPPKPITTTPGAELSKVVAK